MSRLVTRCAAAILCAALVPLAACEWACGHAHDATERVGERLISVDLEERLGAEMAAQMRREVPLVTDPVVQGYVAELGQRLVASTAEVPEGMDFHFRVIDAPDTVNAIAMPGGHIYVFSGLLRLVESESELAAVLAHEIAHVAERHVAAQLVTALGIDAVRALALGDESGQLASLITDFATRGALGAYSRSAEREADRLGVATVAGAGLDPHGYVTFFERLADLEGRPGLVGRFLASHPAPAERARRARELIAELDSVPTRKGAESLRRAAERLE